MQITGLRLHNFRNYETLEITPGPGLNVFVGRNAQGKSNVLEAVYVLATSKSTRASKDGELIRFNCDAAQATADVVRDQTSDVEIALLLSHTEKKAFRLNGVRHTKMAEAIGQMNSVLFDSNDLEIIRGEPVLRRRFLDLEIAQTSPRYVYALGAFRKTLEQRNKVLRDLRDGILSSESRDMLPAYNEQLSLHGGRLMERRRLFLERLAVLATDVHTSLSDGRDTLTIRYVPSFDTGSAVSADEMQHVYLAELERISQDESTRGTTLRGPQRDDIVFMVNNQDCRLYGSQGQQRTVALSLKLAEREVLTELMGEPPILLLDDVLSDLDDHRRRHLFALAESGGSQTFLSCTNLRAFSPGLLEQACVFSVDSGRVTPQ